MNSLKNFRTPAAIYSIKLRRNFLHNENRGTNRPLESACDVLHIICKDSGSIVSAIEKDNYGINMHSLQNLDKRLPKFYFCGINFLIENCSIADYDRSSKKANETAKDLNFPLQQYMR